MQLSKHIAIAAAKEIHGKLDIVAQASHDSIDTVEERADTLGQQLELLSHAIDDDH